MGSIVLLDDLISTNSTSEFITDLFTFINEEREEQTQWDFFLHKVYDKTWKEFCEETKISNDAKDVDLGETVLKSKTGINWIWENPSIFKYDKPAGWLFFVVAFSSQSPKYFPLLIIDVFSSIVKSRTLSS